LRKMYGAFDDICRNSMKGSDEEVINNYQLILNRCNKLITEIGGEEKFHEIYHLSNEVYNDTLDNKSKKILPEQFEMVITINNNINEFFNTRLFLEELLKNRKEYISEKLQWKTQKEKQSTKQDLKNYLLRLTWVSGQKEFLRQMKLLNKDEIFFKDINSVILRDPDDMPYFKRGDECKSAASLYLYWHNEKHINGLYIESKRRQTENIKLITENFKMNSGKEFNDRSLREAFKRAKKDNAKIKVFTDLLKK